MDRRNQSTQPPSGLNLGGSDPPKKVIHMDSFCPTPSAKIPPMKNRKRSRVGGRGRRTRKPDASDRRRALCSAASVPASSGAAPRCQDIRVPSAPVVLKPCNPFAISRLPSSILGPSSLNWNGWNGWNGWIPLTNSSAYKYAMSLTPKLGSEAGRHIAGLSRRSGAQTGASDIFIASKHSGDGYRPVYSTYNTYNNFNHFNYLNHSNHLNLFSPLHPVTPRPWCLEFGPSLELGTWTLGASLSPSGGVPANCADCLTLPKDAGSLFLCLLHRRE